MALEEADIVGYVKSLEGTAFAYHLDDSETELKVGDFVYREDMIETDENSAISIQFADDSNFSLGEDSRLTIDEFVYDPGTDDGRVDVGILKGMFVFVSGKIADQNPENFEIDAGGTTIGIRGTEGGGYVSDEEGVPSYFFHVDGAIIISTPGGTVVIDETSEVAMVLSPLDSPELEPPWSAERIVSTFIEALRVAPLSVTQRIIDADINLDADAESLLERLFEAETNDGDDGDVSDRFILPETGSGRATGTETDNSSDDSSASSVPISLPEELAQQVRDGELSATVIDLSIEERETGDEPVETIIERIVETLADSVDPEDRSAVLDLIRDDEEDVVDLQRDDEQEFVETEIVSRQNNNPVQGVVSIDGAVEEGATLTANIAISDEDGLGQINLQWQADGVDIPGATGDSLTLGADDVGRTITLVVSYVDSLGNEETLASASSVPVVDIDFAPEISIDAGRPVFVEGDAATAVLSGITLSDDSGILAGATVRFESGYEAEFDRLTVAASDTISAEFDIEAGELNLSGEASVADYLALLQSLSFSNNSERPSVANRVISITVDDGTQASETLETGVEVQGIQAGRVIDGPVRDATVFLDLNGNGVLDPDEPSTVTDEFGNYSFNSGSATSGSIVIQAGGIDITTGQRISIDLTTPIDASVVTPLSTMMDALLAAGVSEASARQTLAAIIGLDTVDPLNDDPLALALENPDSNAGVALQAASIRILSIVSLGAGYLASASGGSVSNSNAVAALFSVIANDPLAFDPTSNSFDIDYLLQNAAMGLGLPLAAADEANFLAIEQLLSLVEEEAANARDDGGLSNVQQLTRMAKLAFLVQGDFTDSVNDAATTGADLGSNPAIGAALASGSLGELLAIITLPGAIDGTILPEPVNVAPVVTQTSASLPAVDEDSAAPEGAVGASVASLLDGARSLFDPDSDVTGVAVLADSLTAPGQWFFSVDGGANWQALAPDAAATAFTLPLDARLFYQPATDENGEAVPGLEVLAWDQTAGEALSWIDAALRGGSSSLSEAALQLLYTINPVNDSAVIGGQQTAALNEDSGASLNASGTLTVTDIDDGEESFIAATSTGELGSFSVNELGVWTYSADNSQLPIQSLAEGEQFSETFTVSSFDGTTTTVMVELTGVNDDAVIGGTSTGSVDEDSAATLAASGTLSVSDVDADEAAFQPGSSAGTFGNFSIDASGNWSYSADNSQQSIQQLAEGETVSDSFTVQTVDGTSQSISVTIRGINDPAVIAGDTTASLTEDSDSILRGTGVLTATDVDQGEGEMQAGTFAGTLGSVSIDSIGHWTYSVDNSLAAIQSLAAGETLSDSVTVFSSDGGSETIAITITGVDGEAAIQGDSLGRVDEDSAVTLSVTGALSVVDEDAGESGFVAGSQTGSLGTLQIDVDGNWEYQADNSQAAIQALGAGDSLSETFTVTSLGGKTQELTVSIDGVDDPTVVSGDTVGSALEDDGEELQASGSVSADDPDGGEDGFVPQTLIGLLGTLTIDALGAWEFTADSSATVIQQLAEGASASDVFTVTSVSGEQVPITVTVQGVNDPALVGGDSSGTVGEDNAGQSSASGSLTVEDVDLDEAGFNGGDFDGEYGVLSLDTEGNWVYQIDNDSDAVQALKDGETANDNFTVTTIDGTAASLAFTVTGQQDPASFSGSTTGSVSEDQASTLSASGTITVDDVDDGEAGLVATTIGGAYGSVTTTTDGTWVFNADNSNPNIQSLPAGETVTDTFTLTSLGGDTVDISVELRGVDDATVISGDNSGTATEDSGSNIIASGSLLADDPDEGESGFVTAVLEGEYGDLSIGSSGNWSYRAGNSQTVIQSLAAGDTLQESFVVTSITGATETITIDIIGVNDPASISGGRLATVREDTADTLTASGQLSINDVDNGENSFTPSTESGTYGTLSVAADGSWSYSANNNTTLIQGIGNEYVFDHFTVTSIDGTTQDVNIRIRGVNDSAVISGDLSINATEDNATPISGSLNVNDPDGPDTFMAGVYNGTLGTLTLSEGGTYSFTLDSSPSSVQQLGVTQTLNGAINVQASDGTTQAIAITVNGANDAPTAVDDMITIDEATPFNDTYESAVGGGSVKDNDFDIDLNPNLSVVPGIFTTNAGGSIEFFADGDWKYTPVSNDFVGMDNVDYTLTDGFVTDTATLDITVSEINDVAYITDNMGNPTDLDDDAYDVRDLLSPQFFFDITNRLVDEELSNDDDYTGSTLKISGINGVTNFHIFNISGGSLSPGGLGLIQDAFGTGIDAITKGGFAIASVDTSMNGIIEIQFMENSGQVATQNDVDLIFHSIEYFYADEGLAPGTAFQFDVEFADGNTGDQGPDGEKIMSDVVGMEQEVGM